MNGIVPKHNNGNQLTGWYDYVNQQSVLADDNQPESETGDQELGNDRQLIFTSRSPAPKKERAWWEVLLFGGKTGGLSSCGPQSTTESNICQSGLAPEYSGYANSIPGIIYESDLENGVTVIWKPKAKNCDGSTQGIKLVCHFSYTDGTTEDPEFDPGPDGIVAIQKTLTKKLDKAPTCDLYYLDPNLPEEQLEPIKDAVILHGPTVIPKIEDQPTQCDYSPNPQILGNLEMDKREVLVGEQVKFSIPRYSIVQCDQITGADPENQLEVSFIVDNRTYEAKIDGEYFYLPFSFSQPGDKKVFLKVVDTSRPNSVPQYASIGFYVKQSEDTCFSIPETGVRSRTPDVSQIVRGDGTLFTWTVSDLSDCNGDPLTLLSDNLSDLLYQPTVVYENNTLIVTGQILPTISGGTLRVNFEDSVGNPKIVNLYPPEIRPLAIETPNPYIQQNQPVSFYAQSVPGATNYRFVVTKPDETDDLEENLASPNYPYTPSQAGLHTLRMEVTTYSGDTISVSYPFMVHETPEEAACYAIPDPGRVSRTPDVAQIVKGANTAFTWTISDLTDCDGDPLILVSENSDEFLYNPARSYDGNTLTIAGQILPSISGGTIRVQLQDSVGHTKFINLYLPTPQPLQIETSDNFIQQNEPVSFFLLQEVPGATNYGFVVTKPDGTDDPQVNQASSAFAYTPTQTGLHTLTLYVTAYNGEIISTSYPFVANEPAGTGADVCYSIPDPGLVTQNPPTPQIVRGDNTYFTFTVNDLTDCLGGLLTLFSNNASTILYSPSVNYAAGTLTVSGRVRSTISGGSSIRTTLLDNWG
ncbi:MAG: hypothetical protein V3T21_01165, partial [Candidatus Margulisiibacteriota bacterium]